MKLNTTAIALAVLLLGVGVFAVLRPGSSDENSSNGSDSSVAESNSGGDANGGLKPTRTVTRKEKEDPTDALAEKYGESRTNLSRQIVGNVTGVVDDVIEMTTIMTNGGGFGGRGDWMIRGILKDTEIELDDEQKEQLSELYRDYQLRELEKARADVDMIKEDPSSLMAFMLASDARSREEISEEEFATLQKETQEKFQSILNPLDRKNFRGGRPLEDETFLQDFEGILSEGQATQFAESMSDRDPSAPLTHITEIPVMDLETMDRSIESAKQMTTGFKSMMQGMGNLRELEEQRQESGSEE